MKNNLKKCVKSICLRIPDWLWFVVERILCYCCSAEALEQLKIRRFARKLQLHFEKTVAEIQKNRKCMIISKGDFSYSCFNIAYLCNMLTLILHSLYHGCIQVIKITDATEDSNKWDWYFVQPHEVMGIDISEFEMIECEIANHEFRPNMGQVHNRREFGWNFWQFLFKKYVILNEQTHQYITTEMSEVGNPDKLLGVLIRGTDYIKLKPAGHPVQPEPQEIIDEAKARFGNQCFDGIYVATEERVLFEQVVSAFGESMVFQNKREYYDSVYYSSQLREIGQVHFSRENDNYWKGLEYLSSLVILSQCKSLVAGNCGGTFFAMLMGNYRDPFVFDYGVY